MRDKLRDQHFTRLARQLEAITGVQLPPSKSIMIEGRLRRRMREVDIDELEDYGIHLFEAGGWERERSFLVDCATTNKTDFFREPNHFTFLRDQGIPALLARRDRTNRPLKLWSAASSTGAEAYTTAIVLDSMQIDCLSLRCSILGTDINTEILRQARRPIYPGAMLASVPTEMQKRYVMTAADPKHHEFRIVQQLRRMVQFQALNLMDDSSPFDRDVDVIFCRNVLIYFSRVVQQEVLRRLCSHLQPGGYLILGHSESFALEDKSTMNQVSQTVFERAEAAAVRSAA